MNILKDKYLLEQSQQKSINSKGEEVNLDLGVTANKNIIFGPDYTGFTISNNNVLPALQINMNNSFLSNGATLNSTTGYVQNLGDISMEIYMPENLGGNYNIQINYISGQQESHILLTVNSNSTDELFYATYNWQVENAYIFNTNINLLPGKNVIKISKIEGQLAPWIGTIYLSINNSSYSPQYYTNVVKVQPPAQQLDNGFIGQIGVNGAYLEESVDVPYIGNYVFYIPYLTGPTPVQLIIDTNGQNTGEVYKIPQSQPEWQANILEVQANLNKGSNLIKFYTNNNEKGPWIGPVIVSKIFYYYPVYPGNVTLTGSSNNDSGIIVYSGFGVGGISFTVTNVPKTSQYNLLINYSSPVLSNNVYIYVNGQYIGQPQSFSTTNSINSIAYKIIPINLNQGSNTITIS